MSPDKQHFPLQSQTTVPPRFPKLTYRNPVPRFESTKPESEHSHSEHTRHGHSKSTAWPLPAVSGNAADTALLSPGYTVCDTSAERPSCTTLSRSSAGNIVDLPILSPTNRGADGRKPNFLLGLFSLREPSTSALNEIQKQQAHEATTKSSRTTAVGMPGTSSQKLPSTVPKVNSKWNGLPSAGNDRGGQARKRDSTLTLASHASGSSSCSSNLSSQASVSSAKSLKDPSSLSIARTSSVRRHEASSPLPLSSSSDRNQHEPHSSSLLDLNNARSVSQECSHSGHSKVLALQMPFYDATPQTNPDGRKERSDSATGSMLLVTSESNSKENQYLPIAGPSNADKTSSGVAERVDNTSI